MCNNIEIKEQLLQTIKFYNSLILNIQFNSNSSDDNCSMEWLEEIKRIKKLLNYIEGIIFGVNLCSDKYNYKLESKDEINYNFYNNSYCFTTYDLSIINKK